MASTITGYVSISVFALLAGVPVGIASSEIKRVGLKIFAIIAGIKKCKSIIKKNKKNHDKTVLLAKIELNTIKVLISKAYLYISLDEFVSGNNLLRDYNEMKKEIKNLKNALEYTV